jgi:hypothetical protein
MVSVKTIYRKEVGSFLLQDVICFVQEPQADIFAGVMLHACFLFGLSNHCFFYNKKWKQKQRMPHR